jgi:hypothetical protein
MQIKEMFRRASKYMEHDLPPQGLRWFKAAELVIGHNHELTREEITSWQTEWDGIGPGIVDLLAAALPLHLPLLDPHPLPASLHWIVGSGNLDLNDLWQLMWNSLAVNEPSF